MRGTHSLEELAMRRDWLMLRASRWFDAKMDGRVPPQVADEAIHTISEQLSSKRPDGEQTS